MTATTPQPENDPYLIAKKARDRWTPWIMGHLRRWMAIPDKTDGEPMIRLAAVAELMDKVVDEAVVAEREGIINLIRNTFALYDLAGQHGEKYQLNISKAECAIRARGGTHD